MEKVQGLPPNYDAIRLTVNPPKDALFCWGEKVYTLSDKEIPEDIFHHESIHTKQQGKDIEGWWNKWIQDKNFRYEQELEAYAEQYKFVKERFGAKAQKEALFEIASNLATIYGLELSIPETESKIRNKAL